MKKISRLTVLIMILLLPGPVFSAEVKIKTRVGINGYAVPGTLTPVLIEINRVITNGRLEIVGSNETASYTVINSISINNLKRIETSVFVNENINELKVRLFSGKQKLLETGLNYRIKLFPGNLILALKAPSATQQLIEKALLPSESTLVVPIEIADLPGTVLNYDGVGGLILSDPGPVLKPLQIKALKAWLAQGGRMALGATRSGEDSLLSMFGIDPDNTDRKFYSMGFGGITTFRNGFNDLKLDAAEWRELLNLKPYTEISRIMVGRFFPDFKATSAQDSTEQSSRALSYLAIILIFWAVSGLLVIVATKRKRALFLICTALVWLGAAFPIGSWLGGIWNRGAEIHCHNLILPETGLMLTDVKVRFNRPYSGKTINFKSSPWGGKLRIGEAAHGIVTPRSEKKAFIWSDYSDLTETETVVKSAGSNWVSINGCYPLKDFEAEGMNRIEAVRKLGSQAETVIWDGKDLYKKGFSQINEGWAKMEQPPVWLRNETEWLNNLKRFSPGTIWLMGRGPLSDVKIKIENSVFPGELWASPLPEGALK
jgi:hypothetical protein